MLESSKFIGLQNLPGGILGFHFLDDALQNAILGEDEGAPQSSQRGFSVHLLLAPGAEGLQHLGGRVGEQAEGEFVLGAEAGVRLGAVLAYTHHVVTGGGQFGIIVPERAGFGRAAGGVVLGIKVDDSFAAMADKVLGLHCNTVLVNHLEVGHFVSDLEHRINVSPNVGIFRQLSQRGPGPVAPVLVPCDYIRACTPDAKGINEFALYSGDSAVEDLFGFGAN